METFDVAIVGGGIIGCSVAFELAAEKSRILVLDRQEPGREASWAAAGMLSPAPDSPRDVSLVPLSRESLRIYPEFVRAIEEVSGKAVDYARHGTLQIFNGPSAEADRDAMAAEYRALGLVAEALASSDACKMEPALNADAGAALFLSEEGTVDPRLLMDAALAGAGNRGVHFRAGCGVTSLLAEGNRCKGVMAGGERIEARHVILAAGCFSGKIAGEMGLRIPSIPTRPVRGQMMAMRKKDLRLRRVLRSDRGYMVPRSDGRIVAGSTLEDAGFDKSTSAEGLSQIRSAALELCPGLEGAEILETWAGLRPGTPDDLPILGPTELDGLIIATGHFRNGILLAAATAKLVRDWVVHGRTTFNTEAFSPMRFRENAGVSGVDNSRGSGSGKSH